MATQKRKHVLCMLQQLQQKLEVLERLDKGESLQKLTLDLGIGVTSIKDWKKNRKELECHSLSVE